MRLKLQTQVFTSSGLQSPVSCLVFLGRRGAWLVDGMILTSWLLMVGLVIVYERGGLVGTWLRASRTIPAPLEVREQWFGLYYQGTKVGFTHLMLVPDERDGMPGVTIADRGRLHFTLLGVPQFLDIRTHAFIDADRQLRQVTMMVDAEGYQLRIEGKRQGDDMVLTITGPTSQITQRLKDPAGKLWMGGLSSWTAFHELKVGQEGWLWVVNPLALKPEAAHFVVQGREQLDGTDTLRHHLDLVERRVLRLPGHRTALKMVKGLEELPGPELGEAGGELLRRLIGLDGDRLLRGDLAGVHRLAHAEDRDPRRRGPVEQRAGDGGRSAVPRQQRGVQADGAGTGPG